MKSIYLGILLLFSFSVSALNPAHFTINQISAPYFVVDGNSPSTITQAYVAFEVINNNNSAVTYTNLKFTIASVSTSIAGQVYNILSPSSGIINVGTLAPGASKVCYYYVSYPAHTTAQGTFNIVLSDATANTKSQSFVIKNRSSISANAGGTAVQSFTNQDIIGGIITDSVTYTVGNVQNDDESDFQVAVSSQFDPTKMTLLSTKVTASSVPGIPVNTTDSLYFITGNGSNGATVSIKWTFRISGYNFTNSVLPCAGATSGNTNYKYALNTSLGSGTPITISASANPLLISKTSDRTIYLINSTALVTVTIQNPGAYPVTIDKITDSVPTGFTYMDIDNSGNVTAANSTSVPVANATGVISFEGGVASGNNNSYNVPAGGTIKLKYRLLAPSYSTASSTTTAKGFVGVTQVGAANTTISAATVLAISFLQFNAVAAGNYVSLFCTAEGGAEAESYTFERLNPDTRNFEPLTTVTATAGVTTLSYKDLTPYDGENVYRVRSKALTGNLHYSEWRKVFIQRDKFNIVSVYPSPFADETTLKLVSDAMQSADVKLIMVSGSVVRSSTVQCRKGSNKIRLSGLGNLPAGNYIIQVTASGSILSRKLVKK
jgi:hypothetical protein